MAAPTDAEFELPEDVRALADEVLGRPPPPPPRPPTPPQSPDSIASSPAAGHRPLEHLVLPNEEEGRLLPSPSRDSDSETLDAPRPHLERKRTGDPMVSFGSSALRKPVLRRPPTHRDRGWLFAFLAHLVLVVVRWAAAGSRTANHTEVGAWVPSSSASQLTSMLMLAPLFGSTVGAVVLGLLVLDVRRSWVVLTAEPLAIAAQLGLAILLFAGTSVDSAKVFGTCLIINAVLAVLRLRRTRDRAHFFGVLLDITAEVLWNYPAVYFVVAGAAMLQLCFLLWWCAATVDLLKQASLTSGGLSLVVMLLNLYWVTQTGRLVVAMTVTGSVSHWFASNEGVSCGDDLDHAPGLFSPAKPLVPQSTLAPPSGDQRPPHADLEDASEMLLSQSSGSSAPSVAAAHLHPFARPAVPPDRMLGVDGTAVQPTEDPNAVVLHFLRCAVTTSFGTVCRGGIFALPSVLAQACVSPGSLAGENATLCFPPLQDVRDVCLGYLRCHHELLFVHVAAYSKSFNAASRDVWQLIDESGLEMVQEDDITATVARATSSGVAAVLALVVGLVAHSDAGASWVALTCISFALGFVTTALCLQVMGASVMSIYVCFAENPASLQANFPIVHHRFARIVEFDRDGQ